MGIKKPVRTKKCKGNILDKDVYTDDLPDVLLRMFKKGKTRAQFCAWLEISQRTFNKWLDRHPDFAKAYEVGQEAARAHFEAIAHEHLVEEHKGPKLNTALYNRMMNTRFNVPYQRKLKIKNIAKAKTIKDKFDAFLKEVEAGEFTAEEITGLTSMFDQAVKVGKYDELEQRLKEIEEAQQVGVNAEEFKEVDGIEY